MGSVDHSERVLTVTFLELPGNIERIILMLGPGLPLVLGLALLVRSWQAALNRLGAWSALPAVVVAVLLPSGVYGEFSWLVLTVRLGVDDTGRVFLFFTALLWLLAGMFGRSYLVRDKRQARFFVFYLLSMSGNLGLILAQDVVSFYVFFALMSFSSYGLVVHNGDAEALRAGRIYIYLVVLGEVMLFSALVMLFDVTGSLDLSRVARSPANEIIFTLVFAGFGIKAGALPLHVWLPLAHPAAPTPASAVLSGAMIKAGLLGWLRFLPLGQVASPEWGGLSMGAGVVAAFFGVIVGLSQDNPKTVLAYSSISQMGLMTVGIGAGFSSPAIWPLARTAVVTYALHHAFAKGALFLGVGVAAATGGGTWQRRWLALGLGLPALALAGAPLTTGVVAKTALKLAVAPLPEPWPGYLATLLPLAAVGTTLLMIRFLVTVWPKRSADSHGAAGLRLPWTVMLSVVALSAWLLPEAQASVHKALSLSALATALPPVVAGISLALVVLVLYRRKAIRWVPHLPAGDLVAVGSWVAGPCGKLSRNYLMPKIQATLATLSTSLSLLMEAWRNVQFLRDTEEVLSRWSVVGNVLLSMFVVFFLLLLLSVR
jgi:formate hydrogenlyase subunit 3/multisubunit Na+/H+ antiporter MnhD subunit